MWKSQQRSFGFVLISSVLLYNSLHLCNALLNMCCEKGNGYASQHCFQLSSQFIKLILANVYQDIFVLWTILSAVLQYPARPSQLLYPDALLHPLRSVSFWLRAGLAPAPLPVPSAAGTASLAAAAPGSSQGRWWCLGGCKGVREFWRRCVIKSRRKAVPKRGQLEALAGCPQVENQMQGCEISAESYALQLSQRQLFLTAGVGLSGRRAGNGWAPSARGKHSWVPFESEGLNSISGESPEVDENKTKMCERSIERNKGWENQPDTWGAPIQMAGTLELNAGRS